MLGLLAWFKALRRQRATARPVALDARRAVDGASAPRSSRRRLVGGTWALRESRGGLPPVVRASRADVPDAAGARHARRLGGHPRRRVPADAGARHASSHLRVERHAAALGRAGGRHRRARAVGRLSVDAAAARRRASACSRCRRRTFPPFARSPSSCSPLPARCGCATRSSCCASWWRCSDACRSSRRSGSTPRSCSRRGAMVVPPFIAAIAATRPLARPVARDHAVARRRRRHRRPRLSRRRPTPTTSRSGARCACSSSRARRRRPTRSASQEPGLDLEVSAPGGWYRGDRRGETAASRGRASRCRSSSARPRRRRVRRRPPSRRSR